MHKFGIFLLLLTRFHQLVGNKNFVYKCCQKSYRFQKFCRLENEEYLDTNSNRFLNSKSQEAPLEYLLEIWEKNAKYHDEKFHFSIVEKRSRIVTLRRASTRQCGSSRADFGGHNDVGICIFL